MSNMTQSLYDLSFKDPAGIQHSLADYRGKVLLMVNTATRCGLAPQFEALEALHKEFGDRGLVVIGFPCNQFAGQEPETNETMVGFCQKNFGVTFLLSEVINVNGPNTHPIFAHLKTQAPSPTGKTIKWNFTKFLISRDGQTIQRYAPTTAPEGMRGDVEEMLRA